MTYRPVAYLRRSSASTTNGHGRVSFDAQRTAVLDLAARRGDAEPELVVEWGVSGAAAASAFGGTGRGGRRRAWHELRAAIEQDQVSTLYAYSLSRLARSTRELLDLAELCVAHRVPIRLAKEGDIDGTSPSGRLYLTVLAAVATFEAEVAAERARDRNDAMAERGAYLGRPPYGFRIVDGRLEEHPLEYPTVQRVVGLHRRLSSPAKVARELNDAGVPAPQGGAWADGTIRRILARLPDARPPATVRGSRAVPVATFARLLRCPCGRTLTPARKSYRTAAGERRSWTGYTCPGARYVGTHPRGRAVAESLVLAWARDEASHLVAPDRIAVLAESDGKREELAARRARIVDALESGVITRTEAEPRLARIAAEAESIEAEERVLDVPAIDWSAAPDQVNDVLRALWDHVELDEHMAPVRADWLVPEWRAA